MSLDFRDSAQPGLSTISLGGGKVEISASSVPPRESPSQSWPPPDPSSTQFSSNLSSPRSTPTHSHPPFTLAHPNLIPHFTPTSVPPLGISTVTYVAAANASPTSTVFPTSSPGAASSGSTINGNSLRALSLVGVITLPILVLIILSSMVLFCCRARQRRTTRKTRCRRGEQGRPHSTSVFASLKRSFSDQHKTPSVQHSTYFPAVIVSRGSSPTPEPRGRSDIQSFNPRARDTVVSDPPPPYALHSDTLRPPSIYGRIHTRSPSPTLSEANLSVHNDATLRSPFGSPYLGVEIDALSDISFERDYSFRRHRDMDEVSFVSALDPDEHVERDTHYVV